MSTAAMANQPFSAQPNYGGKQPGGYLQGNVAIAIYKCWAKRVADRALSLYSSTTSIT
jgi:hypothetical protein